MPNGDELQEQAQPPPPPSPPTILMWGFLPACDPERNPLLSPIPAPPPLLEEGWKSVCSGGSGFAVGISEAGKLNTWGSTDNPGQSYVTSGKLEERPEPFPLPSDSPITQAAAGWAHCVVVTEKGEVYTWGWKECVPTSVSSVDQSGSATATAEQDAHESHSYGKDRSEDGVHTNVQLSDHIDGQITAVDTAVKNKGIMAVGVKMKGSSPLDKSRGGLPSSSSKTQLGKLPRNSSTGSLVGVEKAGDEVSKKRKLAVEHVTSPDSSTMGNDEHVSAPPCLVALQPGVQIVSVAAGGRHTLALSDTGQVWGWGYGGEGQLGLGSRIRSVSSPHLIPSIEASFMYGQDTHASSSKGKEPDGALLPKVPGNYVKAVACGGRHSAVVTDAGALLTFGWGLHGQCGQGSTEDEVSPCYVSSLGGLSVKEVAAGLWHTVCITESGDVYSFGGNQFGQLGTGGDQAEVFPRLVEAPLLESQHAVSVSCGARHTAISTDTGKIFCWGWNKYGQLGLGDNLDRNIPAEVPLEGSFAAAVACGWWHTLGLIHCR